MTLIPKVSPDIMALHRYFFLNDIFGIDKIHITNTKRNTAGTQSLATDDKYTCKVLVAKKKALNSATHSFLKIFFAVLYVSHTVAVPNIIPIILAKIKKCDKSLTI